jgi:hypothetical protein
LSLRESALYVAGRITAAGGVPAQVFTREAFELVHEYSRGIPRTINVIADNALLGGFAVEQRPVTRPVVLEVCRDFDIRTPPISVSEEELATGPSAGSPDALSRSEQRMVDSAVSVAGRTGPASALSTRRPQHLRFQPTLSPDLQETTLTKKDLQ